MLILLLGVLIGQPLKGALWDSPEKKAKSYLSEMKKICENAKELEEIGWNPRANILMRKLQALGSPAVQPMINEMLNKNNDWKFRFVVEDLLAYEKRTPDDARLIINAAESIIMDSQDNIVVRRNAVELVSFLAGSWAMLKKDERRQILRNLMNLMENKDIDVSLRWEIVRNLARFAHRFGKEMIEPLLGSLNDSDREIRAIAVNTIGVIARYEEKDKLMEILIEHLKTEKDGLVKSQIIQQMKFKKDKRVIPYLLESLRTGKYCSKADAAELLGVLKVKEAVPLLIEALKDKKDQYFAGMCAEALGNIGDKKAVEPLIEALKNNPPIADDAAKSLAKIGDKRAVPALINVLKSKKTYEFVKRAVASSLMRLGATEAIPLIEKTIREGKKKDARSWGGLEEMLGKFKRGEKINY